MPCMQSLRSDGKRLNMISARIDVLWKIFLPFFGILKTNRKLVKTTISHPTMFKRLSLILSSLLTLCITGCYSHLSRCLVPSNAVTGHGIHHVDNPASRKMTGNAPGAAVRAGGGVTALSGTNGGVSAITWSPKAGTGSTGWLECVYLTPGDGTNHPTNWQRATSPAGPWSSVLPVGYTPIPVSTGSAYKDYYVKFTSLVAGDTPPPQTVARVYCNYKTTVTITYP